jgi:hypothetical protein
MKISILIKNLMALKKRQGDVEVLISSDDEGNSYGSLGKKAVDWASGKKCIILFPSGHIDPMDVEVYNSFPIWSYRSYGR